MYDPTWPEKPTQSNPIRNTIASPHPPPTANSYLYVPQNMIPEMNGMETIHEKNYVTYE